MVEDKYKNRRLPLFITEGIVLTFLTAVVVLILLVLNLEYQIFSNIFGKIIWYITFYPEYWLEENGYDTLANIWLEFWDFIDTIFYPLILWLGLFIVNPVAALALPFWAVSVIIDGLTGKFRG